MNLNRYLLENDISMYRLSQESGIPYTTINDICSGKTHLSKCTGETLLKLARYLDLNIEDLLVRKEEESTTVDFEIFKGNVRHNIKNLGDKVFIKQILKDNIIRQYHDKGRYKKSLYLLAMLDYLSKENHIPLCSDYDDLRKMKLKDLVYPQSAEDAAVFMKNDSVKERCLTNSIPEFRKYNIIEGDIRNVI